MSIVQHFAFSGVVGNAQRGIILIIHGSNDGIVNIDYAKRAREKAVNANSRLIILDGAKHGFNKRQVKIANEHIKAFSIENDN